MVGALKVRKETLGWNKSSVKEGSLLVRKPAGHRQSIFHIVGTQKDIYCISVKFAICVGLNIPGKKERRMDVTWNCFPQCSYLFFSQKKCLGILLTPFFSS